MQKFKITREWNYYMSAWFFIIHTSKDGHEFHELKGYIDDGKRISSDIISTIQELVGLGYTLVK